MERPHRIAKRSVFAPLPTVFDRLASNGIHVCRGELTMIAARSGVGKSNLIQYWVTRLAEKHAGRTMYFSADQNRATVVARMATTLTGDLFTTVKDKMREGESDRYLEAIAELNGRVGFVFEPNPTALDIHAELMAWWTAWGGTYPDVIVIDTLQKVVGDHESEWASETGITKFLQMLARETNSAVIVLHHMAEVEPKKDRVPPKRNIHNKLDKVFELILSLERNDESQELWIGAVKNRNGPMDEEGRVFSRFKYDFEHGQMYENATDWEMRRAI